MKCVSGWVLGDVVSVRAYRVVEWVGRWRERREGLWRIPHVMNAQLMAYMTENISQEVAHMWHSSWAFFRHSQFQMVHKPQNI